MMPILQQKIAKIPQGKLSRMRLLALLLIAITLIGTTTVVMYRSTVTRAAGGDWSTYLHDPQRSNAGSDTTLSPANAGQVTLNWAFKTGGPIAATPAIVGGTAYVGSWDGYEYALDAATGAQKWKTFLGQTTAPCYPQLAGVTSSADVENGVVYVGGGDSNWYALDAATGNVLWKVFIGDNTNGWYNWASPLIYNGFAYIGTASVGDCPLVPGQLLQVSLTTHQIVNTFNFVPQGQYGGGIWTSPSLDTTTNTIYVTTGTRNQPSQSLTEAVVALDATTLTLKSSWAIPASQEVVDSDFGSTPLIFNDAGGNHLVAAINKNGNAYAYNRDNLAAGPVWTQQVAIGGTCPQCGDGSASSGAFGNNTLFMGGGNMVINGQGYKGSVNALDPATGHYRWQHGAPGAVIPAIAYSNGLVIDGAGSILEVLDASSGTRLYSYTTGGVLYAAPSVANGQIFTGGTDGNVYAFGLPSTIPPTPTPDAHCPTGWTCQDIGNPTPAGSETVSGNSWNANAGGTGVGGTSDQFRFLAQNASGDTQISADVVSQQNTGGSAQAGLMVRQSSDPASPYYAIFLKPNNKLVVQYRLAFGGATTTVTQTNAGSPPLYLEIQRVGDQFQAATSTDGVTYTLVPGATMSVPMPAALMEGLALSSGTQGTPGAVSYSAVNIQAPGASPNPPASPSPCPGGWSCSDVGNPALIGDQSLNAGTWTLKGAGKDINGNSDQFHYTWQSLAADGSISAHILSQANTNPSAKAGVMLRQNTRADSAYYAAFVTPGNGIIVQYRPTQGLKTQVVTGPASTVPTYLMIARSGSTYCTYTSGDGMTWSYVIGTCLTLNIASPTLVGLAVTSTNVGTLNTTTFDTVKISTTAPPPPTLCTGGWICSDIGSPVPAGSQSLSGGVWTIQAGGNDIYGSSDQFHFVSQSLAADGNISAHITSQSNSSPWAKAGVMLRQSSDPGSAYYAAYITPANGIAVQYRATQGGGAQQGASVTGTVPTYLMVARSGNTYTAYTSSDGNTWTPVAGSSITLTMNGAIQAGLAVTSHNSSILSTVTFDTVHIKTTTPPPPGCPTNWSCADIGNPALAGSQSQTGSTWTIQGGGGDIWGASDQFHFVSQSLTADGSISAHVTSQTNSDPWAKAGVMLRQSSDPGSVYYAIFVTPANGIVMQYRSAQGGNTLQSASLAGTVPAYLRVARSGNTYTAYTSSDGATWTPLAGSSITLNMSGPVLAGMAVTSHNVGVLATDTFDTVSINTGQPCSSGWNCADIGSPALAGGQTQNGGTWTIQASGTDIFGTADQFHFVSQSLAANGHVSARIVSQTSPSSWAKAGVMLRQSNDPSSVYYAVFVTPGHGIVVQYRTAQGGGTHQITGFSGTVPTYLMVARSGNTYTAYTSSDGSTWTLVAGTSVTLTMSGSVMAGMAGTSHNPKVLGSATFDTVSISTSLPATCPGSWNCSDVGSPTLAGNQSLSGSTWTIQASGTDIFGPSDQFHFVSQSLAADGSVSAHVVSQQNTSGWAKSGVMLRQSTDPRSAYYAVFVTPANGIVVQYRTAQGGGTHQITGFSGTAPTYLMVARSGNTYTAYTSSDGSTWTPLAGSSATLTMNGAVLAGMAVTSHNAKVVGTVTFDAVNVSTTVP